MRPVVLRRGHDEAPEEAPPILPRQADTITTQNFSRLDLIDIVQFYPNGEEYQRMLGATG